MKFKTLLKLLATSLFVISGAASATILGSNHDLSYTGTADPGAGLELDGLCIYCHSPHNGQLAAAPLWNRESSTQTFTMYNFANTGSTTLDMTVSGAPDPFSAACLSCHDGITALDALLNTPYGYTPATVGNTTTWGSLGTDLTNDHPISIGYNPGVDVEFKSAALVKTAGLPLFLGATSADQVECATCHDVHDEDTYGAFLRLSNASSALCLTCHIK